MTLAHNQRTRRRRRSEFLDELLAVFLAEGFEHFTLDDLAMRLRCSKTTLYTLGRNKEDVILNTIKHFYATGTAYIEEQTAGATDPIDRVIAYLKAAAEALKPASPQFHADLRANPGSRAIFELNNRAAVDRIRELVAAGTASSAFRDVHPVLVAEVITVTMRSIHEEDITARTGLTIADAYAELATLILNGIRRHDTVVQPPAGTQ